MANKSYRRKDTLNKYNEQLDFYYALTMFYFVVIFLLNIYLHFVFAYRTNDFVLPRVHFALIFTVVSYVFMVIQFNKFLSYTDFNEERSFSNSVAITGTVAAFVLNSLFVLFLIIIGLCLLGALIYGIITGEFHALQTFSIF